MPRKRGAPPCCSTADEISEDKSFDLLTEAILERDQPRTADLFHQMIVRDGRSVGEALSVVTAAEAPFVNVPCHINMRDGNIALTNNDHTLLGLRASTYLMPYLPEKYRLLPLLQSVWYIGAGLDIWNQLLGKYPGRYATMKGMQVPPPDYGPVVWLEDTQPIREKGTLEERLHSYMIATMTGDSRRAHGLFLGLAEDEENRPALRETIEFLGLIDLQDTVIGRKARNTGHKAIRARAVTDLANYIGWEKSHGVYLHGRARHGGRPALLLAVRRTPACASTPSSRKTAARTSKNDQPDAAVAARGRGHARHADDGRSGRRCAT